MTTYVFYIPSTSFIRFTHEIKILELKQWKWRNSSIICRKIHTLSICDGYFFLNYSIMHCNININLQYKYYYNNYPWYFVDN